MPARKSPALHSRASRRFAAGLAGVLALLASAPAAVHAQSLPSAGSAAGSLFHRSGSKPDKDKKKDPLPAGAPDTALANYAGPKLRLAVMDIENKSQSVTTTTYGTPAGATTTNTSVEIPMPTDFGTGLTEMLTTELNNTGRFILLERKALTDIQNEQAIGASALANPDAAAKAGRLLGAQAIVRGAITEYSYKRSGVGGQGIFGKTLQLGGGKAEASVVLDIRLYDAETGQILDSVSAEGRASGKAANVGATIGDKSFSTSSEDTSPLGNATRQAIKKSVAAILARMEKMPWEGRIAELEGAGAAVSSLYINAGSDTGLKAGDVLEILRPGGPIVDPETKTVIGRKKDVILGRCHIDSVTKKLAIAVPDGALASPPQVGDAVHWLGGASGAAPPAAPDSK